MTKTAIGGLFVTSLHQYSVFIRLSDIKSTDLQDLFFVLSRYLGQELSAVFFCQSFCIFWFARSNINRVSWNTIFKKYEQNHQLQKFDEVSRFRKEFSRSIVGILTKSPLRVNVRTGPAEERILLTGRHSVADIFCASCKTTLGWKYVSSARCTQTLQPCGLRPACLLGCYWLTQ